MSQSNQPRSAPSDTSDDASKSPLNEAPETPVERAARAFSEWHDEGSFAVLCREADPRWKGAISHEGIRKHDIGDVLSRVLLVLWQRRENFAGTHEEFVGFGVAIAANEVMKWRRGIARWKAGTMISQEADALCGGYSPEQFATANELMRALPERERDVFRARGAGHTWEEIAQQVGVSVIRVRQIHASALKRLAEKT